ncbi:DUF6233 domain-containing protein [Streptomyces sp. H10-C2]|uniref:DUF6233 domain-containing protein n=1 Tax=unclassified Streptomyces TaxID=2593676 RepID=UPI0024BBD89C|nr:MULTISPECIES: DUF6233 domain-containing protein [unclassified Streptomyces]MDJ0346349.1 DUF6233 domain-containing protein [Streptomyces sp. PH10-H1]MDJ0374961.1 DUF6233 domain-containing protein [Streptomyces sp. H10-C2]
MTGDRDVEQPASLPSADGPLVRVRLHDGQELYAVVKARRQERDGTWWYLLQIHLPAAVEQRGRLVDEPAPVDFAAPAGRCEPIEGQAYEAVPTDRDGVGPTWKIEEPVYFGPERGPARIVHRGDCHAVRDISHPVSTQQARTVLARPDAAPCPVCRPDRPLTAPHDRGRARDST